MRKKIFAVLLVFILSALLFAGCGSGQAEPGPVPVKGKIILSTTTSTEDSGLLSYILPVFTGETGWEVDTVAVGTGAALQMGRDGQADVLLVHARADEIKFVGEGYAERRYDVMYNDFIILGPQGGAISHNGDVAATFQTIAGESLPFVSRGDDSGTHKKELSIWQALGIDPESNANYISVGQGMGATIGVAVEMDAYTLSDRATWLTYSNKGNLEVVCEKDEELLNYYGVIPVSASVNESINTEGGQAFADWIISKQAQDLIGTFGVEEFGEPLFTPNA